MHGPSAEVTPLDIWLAVATILLCVALSAFFAASETALTAASRARMHGLEKNGDPRAARVNRLLMSRERLIGTTLLGNTLVNIGASAFTTSVLVAVAGDRGAIYATGLMTIILLVFAEVMPKTVAINYPDRTSLLVARAISFFVAIFGPVLIAVEVFVRGLLKLAGVDTSRRHSILSGHEELKSAVDLLHREGGVARSDRDMFGGLLELRDLEVSDVMVHRTKMLALNADLPPQELIREVAAAPYSRLPLWRGEPENIVGVLHARDLLRALEAAGNIAGNFKVESIAIEPWFVPDSTPVQDQLQAFLKRKTHFALVVDEYGVVMGLVTLEDIIEEIVGDIADEHDVIVQGVRMLAGGSAIVDGSVPIRDLNRVMGWDLPDEEATTVAGLVINEARAIPESGQVFTFHNFRFEVLRKTRNRITSLKIMPEQPGAETAANA
ncbi:HlyC/CorC family transporter [Methylocapsa sp. D3K7]|uniref:HlyC/CorC family transporter n=1 Tax=Methylocapsa sp. D3K7 TaxID=3041435 RepID=UPI00244EC490|nr:HlyC/CorC family transporter [Methylocapsa sp. D3K7]WGJ13983.1 HlyC/CorC family transporter [Methylocapsa sp. D3K7]